MKKGRKQAAETIDVEMSRRKDDRQSPSVDRSETTAALKCG
jgi:hypothetical protein